MIDTTAVEMLRDAAAAQLANHGTVDPKTTDLLERAEAGTYHLPNFRGVPDSGPKITGVKRSGGPITATEYTYERQGNGGNGNSSHRAAEPMTGPQEGFIYRLLRTVPAEVAEVARPWFEANKATMTKAAASHTIDRLKVHADNAPAAPATAPSTPQAAPRVTLDRSAAWVEWRLHAAELAAMGNSTGARFAVPSTTGNNDLDFWCIVRREGTDGRSDRYYLNRVIGGRPDIRTRMTPEAMVAVARVIRTDARAAMTRYGVELQHCGRCGRHLTDDESRARGIGPDCWGRM